MRHYADGIGRAQQLQQPVFEPAGLGRANCTPRNAEILDRAMLNIILSRAEELMKLAQICYEHKGHLLDAVEVDPNEL